MSVKTATFAEICYIGHICATVASCAKKKEEIPRVYSSLFLLSSKSVWKLFRTWVMWSKFTHRVSQKRHFEVKLNIAVLSGKSATLTIFVYTAAYGPKNIEKSTSTLFLIDLNCEKHSKRFRIRVKWDRMAHRVRLWHSFEEKLNVAVFSVKTATLRVKN